MTYAQIAGSPEFSALTPEEKKTVAQRFWADDPERAEIATSLVDTNLALPDASPVEKRFLEAKAEDQAFSLIETTPEQAQEYAKFRDERNARLDKTNQLFSDDGARVIGNLIELGQTTNLFGDETLRAKLAGTTDQNNQRYNESRNLVAEQFGVSTDELDDVVRHNLGNQEKAISRDSFGQVHFKNDLLLKGRDELTKAIESSDLPASVKSSELEGLDQRLAGFETSVVDSVKKNYPEYAQFIGLDGNNDYQKIANSLIQGVGENETTSITNAFRKSGTAIFNALNKLPGSREDRSNLFASVADEVERSRKIDEGQLALSNEFNKEKLRFLGTTGGSIGGGAYSVLESAALAYATGGLVPTLSGTGRLVAGANAALRVAPVATTFGVRQGMETYDRAVAAKVDEKEALKLGVVAGLIEGGLTTAFSALGMGGVESAVAGGAKEVARKTIGNSLKEIGKSVIGEELEENTINALNNALVETKINPNMTVEDFKQSVYDTTIATLLPAGAVGAATNIPTFQQTTPELEQRANAIYSEEDLPSLEAPGGTDTQASVDPVVDERAGIEERLKIATGEEREALLERRDEIDAETAVENIAPENIPDEIVPDAPVETTLPTEDQTETLPTESSAGEPVVAPLNQEITVPETQINEPQPNPPSTPPVGVEETSGTGETTETVPAGIAEPEQTTTTPVEETAPPATEQPQLGLRKSLTTQVRKRFGLSDPGIKVSQTDREAIDAADSEIKANPEKGRQLVVSLRDSGRATNKTEAAILNHELVRLNNELEKAEKAIQDAPDQANTSDAIARADLLRSELDETLDVIERQGSSAGLRLQAQKLIRARDYSLEGLQRRALASKNRGAGERQTLTKEESDQLRSAQNRIKELEDEIQGALVDQEIRLRKEYEDRAVNNAAKEVKREKQKDTQKAKVARLDQQIKDARKRLKDRQSNDGEERRFSGANFTEKDVVDVAIIATAYIRKGVISLQEFTRNLVNEFGEGIEPLAQQIFDESKRVLNASGLLKTPEQIVAENPDPNRQTAYNLLKAHIRNGMVGNAAVDAVAKDLKMERSEVVDLITTYDRTINPTRNELRDELNSIRRAERKLKRKEDISEELKATKVEERTIAGLKARTAKIQERLRTGNLSPEVRQDRQDTERIQKARFEYDKAKAEIDRRITELALKNQTTWQKILRNAGATSSFLKMAKLTGDLGNFFRNVGPQTIKLTVTPWRWKQLGKMYTSGLKTILSKQDEYNIFKAYSNDSTIQKFGGIEKLGLKLVNPLDESASSQEAGMSLDFVEKLAEMGPRASKSVTGKVTGTTLGSAARASLALERANRTWSTIARAEMFTQFANYGDRPLTIKEAKDLAQSVNILTGYGGFSQDTKFGQGFEKAVPFLNNTIALSARWALAKIQYGVGIPIWNTPGYANKARIIRDYYALNLLGKVLMGAVSKFIFLALKGDLPEDEEEWKKEFITKFNPYDSSNGGKLNFDGTTISFDSGNDAFLSLLAKSIPFYKDGTWERREIKNGKWVKIDPTNLGEKWQNYFGNRVNPVVASLYRTLITGQNYDKKPLNFVSGEGLWNVSKEFLQPIIAADIQKMYENHGIEGVLIFLDSFHGANVRFKPDPQKEKPKKVTYSF